MSSSQQGLRTLVLGLGETGLAAVEFVSRRAGQVRVADTRAVPPGLGALRDRYPDVDVRLGDFAPTLLEGIDQVIVSPGLATDIPLLEAARQRQIAVLGDIELFARSTTLPVVAVTGSNGKSTVTTLVAQMLEGAGYRVRAGGNLGPPALSLLDAGEVDGYVLELSSFQLENTCSLTSQAATVLNVSADHLDRHHDLAAYAAIKARVLENARVAVINRDDPIVARMAAAHARRVTFGLNEPHESDFGVRTLADRCWLVRGDQPLLAAAELRQKGAHNVANGLAALALAEAFGAPLPRAVAALKAFIGLPHRCEWVGEWQGVTWINDSKGTNVGATVAALSGLEGPLILIAGGEAKGADFAPLAAVAGGKVKVALLLGKDAAQVAAALEPVCAVRLVDSMEEAVTHARRRARRGDTVLLSPACASLDMYENFEARGQDFKALVQAGSAS